jgi:hypothetical protein
MIQAHAHEMTFWQFVLRHRLEEFFVFSVLIEQLPPPDNTSGKFYVYAYGVVQALSANFRRTKDALTLPPKV